MHYIARSYAPGLPRAVIQSLGDNLLALLRRPIGGTMADRREFLQAGTLAAAAASTSGLPGAQPPAGATAGANVRLETTKLAAEFRPADGALVRLENRL